jgi:hypothetical protein
MSRPPADTTGATGTTGRGTNGSTGPSGGTTGGGTTGGGTTTSSGGTTGSSAGGTGVGPSGGSVTLLHFGMTEDTRPPACEDTANYPTAVINTMSLANRLRRIQRGQQSHARFDESRLVDPRVSAELSYSVNIGH